MIAWRHIAAVLVIALGLAGCASEPGGRTDPGWIALFNGSGLDDWHRLGDANWRVVDGILEADTGAGFLVSRAAYADFEIRAEFWADERVNSGIFLRCTDTSEVTPFNSYEVNIWDSRPDPSYGTGAIVGIAAVSPMPRAARRWNTYEITARGGRLTVVLNGVRTVDVIDNKFSRGAIALQAEGGTIRFRRIEIRPL